MTKRKRRKYSGVRFHKGRYEYSFYSCNTRIWKRVNADSLKEAYEIKIMEMAKSSSEPNVESLPFDDLKKRLEMKCRADGNSEKTIKNFLWKFHTFFEEFIPKYYPHITNVNQVSKSVVERYKQYIVVDLKRELGWRDEIGKLKSMIGKLVKVGCCNKRIKDDVLREFEKPPAPKKLYKEIKPMNIKKLLAFIKKDRPDYYGITYLIARLGWRRGQVISLKKTDVKVSGFKPIEIHCEPATTKTKQPHVLRNIDKGLADVLAMYRYKNKPKSDWLFPNALGNMHHVSHYSDYVSKVSQRVLRIRLTPHDFRHSFITRMKAQGYSDRDIMAITGHKNINSFQIYQHPTTEGTKKVLEASKL